MCNLSWPTFLQGGASVEEEKYDYVDDMETKGDFRESKNVDDFPAGCGLNMAGEWTSSPWD